MIISISLVKTILHSNVLGREDLAERRTTVEQNRTGFLVATNLERQEPWFLDGNLVSVRVNVVSRRQVAQ